VQLNIIQEYLINKRKFELLEKPIVHYKKRNFITDNLSIDLIIVFKDYEITFGQYLYFRDYCCFALMNEQNHKCQNVTQLFDLVKTYDRPISLETINNQLQGYRVIASQKTANLQKENYELVEKVTAAQRASSMFSRGSADYKNLTAKLNNLQAKLNRNQKEIEILTKVAKELLGLSN
jgi:hypothetical protein